MEIIERKIYLDDADLLLLFGFNDVYLKLIENRFKSNIIVRGNNVIIKGEPEEVAKIETVFRELVYMIKKNGVLNEHDVSTVLDLVETPNRISKNEYANDPVIYKGAKDYVRARNKRQLEYYRKVLDNDIVFAIGPAGTGKTFLAVAMALQALRNNEASRIILSRPAVEAGESLGFLPGDLAEKIDPYIRPLTDSLLFLLTAEKYKSLKEKDVIEVNPLAYMRGRTLNNSFIILDEAQNSTKMQMKMFLTRLGINSKAIITGDITQIDLANKRESGLVHAKQMLNGIEGIEFVYFDNRDVVRHRLVSEIIKAYEKQERKEDRHSSFKDRNEDADIDNNLFDNPNDEED